MFSERNKNDEQALKVTSMSEMLAGSLNEIFKNKFRFLRNLDMN